MSEQSTDPKAVVLALVLQEIHGTQQVLLGRKLTGFGAGNVVAPGGKVELEESARQAASRELAEETSLSTPAELLMHRATVRFRFPARPASDMDCEVFTANEFSGTPRPSSELDARWFDVEDLPLDQMWQDADHWLPKIIHGEQFTATVVMAEDNLGVQRVEFNYWQQP